MEVSKKIHIAITRFSSLGDIVIQTAFIKSLKKQYPNSILSFITLSPFVDLIENHPSIDHIVGYEKQKGLKDIKGLKDLTKKVEQIAPIDFIIDLHGTTRSFLFKFLNPKIPTINLDKRRLERFLFIRFKFNFLKKTPSNQKRLIYDLKGLLKLDTSVGTELKRFEKNCKLVQGIDKYIVIAPIASFKPKLWPIKSYEDLIIRLLKSSKFDDYSIVVLGGPSDSFEFNIDPSFHSRFLNLKGKTSLSQSRQIIQFATLVLGNDTGMGHIAESYGVASLVIFGPTHPSLGFAPYLEQSLSLTTNQWCSPCSGTGKKKCWRSEQFCMTGISVDRVQREVESRL